jgi:hypothetical protein
MAQHKNKRIEFLSAKMKYLEETPKEAEINFGEVLIYMNGRKCYDEFKEYELRLLSTDIENCIVGIIITDQNKSLPPKRNRKTGAHSKLGINIWEESLSFGNVFLYDRNLNVFLYELNRDGCYIDQLIAFIQKEWTMDADNVKFSLSFHAISRKGEYERLLNMRQYTDVFVELTRPSEILQDYKDDKSAVFSTVKRYLKDGVATNSDTMIVRLSTYGKRKNKQGLDRAATLKVVNSAKYLLSGTQKKNVKTLQVKGYFTDPDERDTIKPVNLVADTFDVFIKLPVETLLSDLQENDRKVGIENVYKLNFSELKYILRRDSEQ